MKLSIYITKPMKKEKYFRITFSCSEDELRAIRQTAADCGMSMSMYCKKVVLGFRPKYRLSEEDISLMQEVRKVKSDLQRIANYFKYGNHQLLMEELAKVINKLKTSLYDCNR